MLKSKIKMNEYIRNKIYEERMKADQSGIDLSKKIGKSDSWISLIENSRILTVSSKDLINIFKTLLSISESEAEQYIEKMLAESMESLKQQGSIVYYDEDKSLSEENFIKITDSISKWFNLVFEDNPEYAFNSLGKFMENLTFDTGLMLALIGMPFKELENTDIEVRKKMFKEISNIVQRYINES